MKHTIYLTRTVRFAVTVPQQGQAAAEAAQLQAGVDVAATAADAANKAGLIGQEAAA